jgi:Spy/CpxP family protein refolding chaperone
MKKILSTALAIVLFIGASQAQATGKGKDRQHGKKNEMMKELNLSAEQKAKLKTIHEAEKNEMQGLKANGRTEADKAARKEIHEKYKTQLESVLTEEQKAKFKEGRKEGRGDNNNNDGREERGREMGRELNLSADQKTKVASLNTGFKTKMEAIRNNSSLTNEEKKAQTKSIAEAHKMNLNAILTPEQAAKMTSLRKGHHKKDRKEIL